MGLMLDGPGSAEREERDAGAAHPAADDQSVIGSDALESLVPAVYDELRAIAHRRLVSQGKPPAGGTLATTALVHEAYLKLAAGNAGPWRDRAHFLAVAAIAMRQILVDRARARASHKRGGAVSHATLEEDALAVEDRPELLLEIDEAVDRLAVVAPRLARLVELRFYGGLSEEEIAGALGLTTRTVQRDWVKARMLLQRALAP
jgi:RNA polymerase sigma factor (TIGR02999 family)